MRIVKKWVPLFKLFTSKHPGTSASSIAFYCFMSMVPLLVLFACLVPVSGVSADSLIEFFKGLVPELMYGFITRAVKEAYQHSNLALSISIVTLLFVSSQFITAMIYGLNSIYDAEEKRSYPKLVLMSIFYMVVFVVFLTVVIYLIFSQKIFKIINILVPGVRIPSNVTAAITSVIMAVVGALFFALIYKFLPAGRRRLGDQMPGALLCTAGWYIFSFLFRIYVDHFNRFTRFYGSLAIIALFLFWIYWIFYMLLGGGFVNRHAEELGLGRLRFRRKKDSEDTGKTKQGGEQ